jgi:hypothetical protein
MICFRKLRMQSLGRQHPTDSSTKIHPTATQMKSTKNDKLFYDDKQEQPSYSVPGHSTPASTSITVKRSDLRVQIINSVDSQTIMCIQRDCSCEGGASGCHACSHSRQVLDDFVMFLRRFLFAEACMSPEPQRQVSGNVLSLTALLQLNSAQ